MLANDNTHYLNKQIIIRNCKIKEIKTFYSYNNVTSIYLK